MLTINKGPQNYHAEYQWSFYWTADPFPFICLTYNSDRATGYRTRWV